MSVISGILNIDKPKGLTSHDVVARIRKLSGQRKVGHTGTLDPMATGVLIVCLGQATRLIEYLQKGKKQYRAVIRFGITTDTLDVEGNITTQNDASGLTSSTLEKILPAFQGEIDQIPPIFSAIKQDGQPLYKLARAGKNVYIKPRRVTIDTLDWVEWQHPDLTIDVSCSTGTYIRSLARDLGEAAGPGAHLIGLTRTVNSDWPVSEAVALETLERLAIAEKDAWKQYLYPIDLAVAHLPQVKLSPDDVTRIQQGQRINLSIDQVDQTEYLLSAYTLDGTFLAILTRVESDDTLWQPKKVFHLGGTQ